MPWEIVKWYALQSLIFVIKTALMMEPAQMFTLMKYVTTLVYAHRFALYKNLFVSKNVKMENALTSCQQKHVTILVIVGWIVLNSLSFASKHVALRVVIK